MESTLLHLIKWRFSIFTFSFKFKQFTEQPKYAQKFLVKGLLCTKKSLGRVKTSMLRYRELLIFYFTFKIIIALSLMEKNNNQLIFFLNYPPLNFNSSKKNQCFIIMFVTKFKKKGFEDLVKWICTFILLLLHHLKITSRQLF